MKFVIIILCILIIYYIYYSINCSSKLINLINPCNYSISSIDLIKEEQKIDLTKLFLKEIKASAKVFRILKNIKKIINKNLVYSIKKKDFVYRLELYLYGKEIDPKDYSITNKSKFLDDVKKILKYFNHNFSNKLNKIINDKNITITSFDLDLDGNFNDRIHLYMMSSDKKDEIINHVEFIKNSHYTLDYDLRKDTFEYESFFTRLFNLNELETVLDYYKNIKGYKIDIKYIFDEIYKINPSVNYIMFHYKYYNNSIGIYFVNNDVKIMNKFFKLYNYPFEINERTYKDFNFDIGINYIIDDNKINSSGFFDFI